MARAALLGRLNWRAAQLVAVRGESASARTLVLDVPGWPGHLAGQHVDVRLTAEDGYSTQRSYSIPSAPAGARLELTVERLEKRRGVPVPDLGAGSGGIGWSCAGWSAAGSAGIPGDLDRVLLLGGGSGVCRCWRWSALLVDQGDAPAPIRIERFGPSGA
jgi:hypothetical protein